MANETTITTAASLMQTLVDTSVLERAAAAQRVFRDLITEVPFTGPGSVLSLQNFDLLTAAAYTEAGSRTFTTGDPTGVSVTPIEVDVAMAFTDKLRRRSPVDLVAFYTPELSRAIAVKIDADCAAEDANMSITAVDEGDSSASVAKLLEAMGAVRAAAKDQVSVVNAVLHVSAWDNILVDSTHTAVQVRGEGSALVSGQVSLLGGGLVRFTTAIESNGATTPKYNNMVFNRRAITLVYKSLLQVDVWDDRDIKSVKIGATADYDIATRYGGEGVLYTVTI